MKNVVGLILSIGFLVFPGAALAWQNYPYDYGNQYYVAQPTTQYMQYGGAGYGYQGYYQQPQYQQQYTYAQTYQQPMYWCNGYYSYSACPVTYYYQPQQNYTYQYSYPQNYYTYPTQTYTGYPYSTNINFGDSVSYGSGYSEYWY